MGFSYQVYSEQEAMQERYQLLKEGEYDAVIASSVDKVSSSGNPMMDMTLNVFDDNGRAHDVRDFLVFTTSMMWKVVHFADSSGLLVPYQDGCLCSDVVIGNRVRVKVTIEQGGLIPQDKLKGKSVGSRYPDKNKIEDYVKKGEEYKAPSSSNEPFKDDDIPFL